MSTFENLGFSDPISEMDFMAFCEEVLAKSHVWTSYNGNTYYQFNNDSGASVTQYISKSKEFLGMLPFYKTKKSLKLNIKNKIQIEDSVYGYLKGESKHNKIFLELVGFPIAKLKKKNADVFVWGSIEQFYTKEEIEVDLKSGIELSENFHIFPFDFYNDDDLPVSYAISAIKIINIEKKFNTYTNKSFYVITGQTAWGEIDFVSKDIPKTIESGQTIFAAFNLLGQSKKIYKEINLIKLWLVTSFAIYVIWKILVATGRIELPTFGI